MWMSLAASKFGVVEGQRATTNRDRIGKSLTPAQVKHRKWRGNARREASRTATDRVPKTLLMSPVCSYVVRPP